MKQLRTKTIAGLAGGLVILLSSPALAFHDSGLDPAVGQPLIAMLTMANQQCQIGNQQGCMTAQQIQQAGNMLSQAQSACQQGNQQACQMYQTGTQQVMQLYQQVQMGQMAPQPGIQGQMPQVGSPNGFDANQMQMDHQQRMQDMQNQFNQQNQQWQQNQILNDQRHQQFMDTLRQ